MTEDRKNDGDLDAELDPERFGKAIDAALQSSDSEKALKELFARQEAKLLARFRGYAQSATTAEEKQFWNETHDGMKGILGGKHRAGDGSVTREQLDEILKRIEETRPEVDAVRAMLDGRREDIRRNMRNVMIVDRVMLCLFVVFWAGVFLTGAYLHYYG